MTRRLTIALMLGILCWSVPQAVLCAAGQEATSSPETGQRQAHAAAGTEAAQPQPEVVRLDSDLVFIPLGDHDVLNKRFEENTARSLSTYLAVGADRFYGFERYELSKARCALYGADSGVTLGLIAGALGMSAGLWDERTAWYIAGAAAVLGALRGVSMADEPEFRVRLRWDETGRSGMSR